MSTFTRRASSRLAVLVALCVPLTAIADSVLQQPHKRPAFVQGDIAHAWYDGVADDLLTAGLGKTGLFGAAPAACATATPTAAQLRTCVIYTNYRALADMSVNGGYGVLYGPNIDLEGHDTLGEGKIAGDEYLAYADDGTGRLNVTMMVQVPASFDAKNPCIVAAPSSGSRGVYGAIGTTGEWGLKRGCAVAYTDKGTGSGVHDLAGNTVNLIRGTREDAATAGKRSNFTAAITDAQRSTFNAVTPNRFAVKHAHSQQNPEATWGRDVLQSLEFAFYVLNLKSGGPDESVARHWRRIHPQNTLVIASSVSNGGGASLAAAELDPDGLIDGIVVSEPQVQPDPALTAGLTIMRGATVITGAGKGLYDYITLANLYQPCAALAASNAGAPGGFFINATRATNRCAALKAKGLLTAVALADQATEAQAILNANGWEPESNILGPSHYGFQVAPAVTVTYANAHGRFSVLDNVCGFSFGATGATGQSAPLPALNLAQIFATGNGVPPTSGINLINNLALGGVPLLDPISASMSSGLEDYNADGAQCLRELFTGGSANAARVDAGIEAVQQGGNLHGKPAIIVHGRADNLVPVNHASRPYFGLNKVVEGQRSRLVYYEVTNAQHFEAFIGIQPLLAGYDTRYIPLHKYGIEALNLMYAHLKHGAALPASQVVRTIPRGGVPGAAPPITPANVPPIASNPAAADAITFSANTVRVPD
jgi:hydroxybutyrate-dimer hydrolase